MLHLLPISSLSPASHVDVERVASQKVNLRPLYLSKWDSRFNLDGYLTHATDRESGVCYSYVQFFRNGAIEVADSITIDRAGKNFAASDIENELLEAMPKYLAAYKAVQIEPPIVVMVSLLGVKGYYIRAGQFKDARAAFDRDTLLLPDLLIEDLSVDVVSLLKPVFDAMWQASGWRRCFNYDDAGKRVNNDKHLRIPS